jgi:hypothetical protein
MDVHKDTREIRLCDLTPFDTIVVRCVCGRIVDLLPGVLARLHRVKQSTRIAALRFRCEKCARNSGFRVSLFDERDRGDNLRSKRERIIVRQPSCSLGMMVNG